MSYNKINKIFLKNRLRGITAVVVAGIMSVMLVGSSMYITGYAMQIVKAAGYTGTVTGVDEGGLRVRSSASTATMDNIITKVYEGDTFDILDTVYNGSSKWYQIGFIYNDEYTYGYVSADYVTVSTNGSSDDNNSGDNGSDDNASDDNNGWDYDDTDFETELEAQGFPESYKTGLRQIHKMYPDWIFTAEHIDREWNDIIDNESVLGRSLVYGYAKESWKSKAEGAYDSETGEYTEFDSGGWVQASNALIKYAIDPRNFLNETNIFMFEDLAYSDKIQTEQGVRNVIAGSFMDNSSHELYFDDKWFTYPSALMYAGAISGVSPYHLATRIIQEQGYNGQGLSISGTYPGYEGLFNYYNQGAYKSGSISAVENGLIYASKEDSSTYRAWNSRMKSIVGGAKILGANYINRGQNTLYYEKFDMITPYSHQYMTFILAPRQESVTASRAYSDSVKSSTALRFLIPIYNDMPDTACPLPGDGYVDDSNNNNDADNNGEDIIKFTGMKLDGDGQWRYYVEDNPDYGYTGMAANEYGWWYFNDGELDLGYTGMAANEYGWWYFNNGILDTGYTGIAANEYGSWYYIDGTIAYGYTGMILDADTWKYVSAGYVDNHYTGMALNENGWWYFDDGMLDTGYTGMALNEYGWWYFNNGILDIGYTGIAANEYGSWYYIDGTIAYGYTGMILDADTWKYVSAGYVDNHYTGMALNENGWWYFDDGMLDTGYTGMALNEYGWWYFNNGILDIGYTGIAANEYGSWYYIDGTIAYGYTGMILDADTWKYVSNGYVDNHYTGTAVNEYGTWNFIDGQLQL